MFIGSFTYNFVVGDSVVMAGLHLHLITDLLGQRPVARLHCVDTVLPDPLLRLTFLLPGYVRDSDVPSDGEPPGYLPADLPGRVTAALLVVAAGPEVAVADRHLHLLTVRAGASAGALGAHSLRAVLSLGADGASVAAAVGLAGGGGAGARNN